MVEDMEAIRQLEEIASIEGVDLIAVGPTDLAQALGVSDTQDPHYVKTIEDISATLIKVGKAKLTFPLNHPVYPLGVTELQKLGAAYANCGPADVYRLLNSYRQQIQEIRTQL